MPIIEGVLETFTEEPADCVDLDQFSCGDKRHAYEETVERIIAAHRRGTHPKRDAVLRVTREMPEGTIVGLSIIFFKYGPAVQHPPLGEEFADAAYIDVVTLSEEYRGDGGYTCPDGTPVSDFVLAEALRHIEAEEGTMPVVQAVVESPNTLSQELLGRHGFEQPFVTGPDLLYVRLPDADEASSAETA